MSCSCLGTDLVKLYVGPKRKEFGVHKSLLCKSSHFFDAALNGPYIEGQEGKMYLPEDDPGAFSLYVEWLYRGSIRQGNTEQHLHDLYDLYLLAEKICLIKLKNLTMDSIQNMAWQYDLRDVLVTKELLTKISQRTSGSVGAPIGLRLFAAYTLSWHSINTEKKNLTSDNVEEPVYVSVDVEVHCLIWDICKDDFAFFRAFQMCHESHLQRCYKADFETTIDPRTRDETDEEDWCFFHDHSDGSNCMPARLSRQVFLPLKKSEK